MSRRNLGIALGAIAVLFVCLFGVQSLRSGDGVAGQAMGLEREARGELKVAQICDCEDWEVCCDLNPPYGFQCVHNSDVETLCTTGCEHCNDGWFGDEQCCSLEIGGEEVEVCVHEDFDCDDHYAVNR